MAIVGVGIDVVSIPDFAEQVDQPGTVFAETFTPGERRDAADKSSVAARHLAARWAAKEAVIKAWSGSRFAQRPVLPEGIHRDIEVITDMWGRPRVRLMGAIAEHLADVTIHVSLTHEGDTAAAVAILETLLTSSREQTQMFPCPRRVGCLCVCSRGEGDALTSWA